MPSSSRKVDEIDRADVGIRPYGRSKPLPYKTYFAFFLRITAPQSMAAAQREIQSAVILSPVSGFSSAMISISVDTVLPSLYSKVRVCLPTERVSRYSGLS